MKASHHDNSHSAARLELNLCRLGTHQLYQLFIYDLNDHLPGIQPVHYVLTNCAFLNILDKAFHNLKVHVRFKKGHPDFPQRGFYVVLRKSSLATQVPEYILKFLR